MAKVKKMKSVTHRTQFIPQKYQHIGSILVICVSLILFFHEIVFEGKIFVAADTIASKSFNTLVNDAVKEGVFPLWNPYIFCGMPGYASLSIHGDRYYDLSAFLLSQCSLLFGVLMNNPDIGWCLFYYLLLGIGLYVFIYSKLNNKIASLVASLAVVHSTFIVILIMVGHMTKVPVLAFFPWTFLIIERLREKFNLYLSILLVFVIHYMLLPSHLQIIFYCYLVFGIYFAFYFIRKIVRKESLSGIVRSGLIFVFASVFAFLMTSDQYFSTLEYSKYSIRGSDPIIESLAQTNTIASGGGLDYEYATQWSFSPKELWTLFIPSAYGFGNYEPTGVLRQSFPTINTYFGPQTFTDAPQYMGVIILLLAGIGIYKNIREPFVQFSIVVIIIFLLLSFGKEFPYVYNLFFKYFPFFNKFRVPSMALVMIQIFIPLMAGYGIASIYSETPDKKNLKVWRYVVAGALACTGLFLVNKDVPLLIYEFLFPKVDTTAAILNTNLGQYLLQATNNNTSFVVTELYGNISRLVTNDFIVGALLLSAMLSAMYLFWNKKMNVNVFSITVIVLVIFDLWRVNYKPMVTHDRQQSQSAFSTPQYVEYLKQDRSLYRVLEFENGSPPYNNILAYWRIQNAFGYQGAKMRQIQDMFDVIGFGNPLLWGLMNVKYIISDRIDSNHILQPVFKDNKTAVMRNTFHLPRAFFVNRYEVLSGKDILMKISQMQFDPYDVAFSMEEIIQKIDTLQPGSYVYYSKYGIQELELKVKTMGNNLLFISETWYPEGWKAYIDEEDATIYRVNYMFRGVVVPPGEHTLRMIFEPQGFYLGKNIVLTLNGLFFLTALISVIIYRKKNIDIKGKYL